MIHNQNKNSKTISLIPRLWRKAVQWLTCSALCFLLTSSSLSLAEMLSETVARGKFGEEKKKNPGKVDGGEVNEPRKKQQEANKE